MKGDVSHGNNGPRRIHPSRSTDLAKFVGPAGDTNKNGKTPPLSKEVAKAIFWRLVPALAAPGKIDIRLLKGQLASEYGCSSTVQIDGIHAHLTKRAIDILKSAGLFRHFVRRSLGIEGEKVAKSEAARVVCRLENALAGQKDEHIVSRILADFRTGAGLDHRQAVSLYKALERQVKADREQARKNKLRVRPKEGFVLLKAKARDRALRTSAHTVDFGFPSKLAWQKAWSKGLSKFRESLKRADQEKFTIGCLPGIRCKRELLLLQSLGIPGKGVIAFEAGGRLKDSKQRRDHNIRAFQDNFESVKITYPGIRSCTSRVEHIQDTQFSSVRFSAFIVDSEGYLGRDKLEALSRLYLNESSYLVVNLMACRESREMQDQLVRLFRLHNGDAQFTSMRDELVNDEVRAGGIGYMCLTSVGVARPENWGKLRSEVENFKRLLNGGRAARDGDSVADVSDYIERAKLAVAAIKEQLAPFKANTGAFFDLSLLDYYPWLGADVCFGRSKIASLEKHYYHSESSRSHNPFMSWFAKLDTPLKQYAKWASSAKFMIDLVIEMTKQVGGELGVAVIDSLHQEVTKASRPSAVIDSNDRLCLTIDGRARTEKSINIKELLRQIEQYRSWHDQYVLQHPIAIAREPLNVIRGKRRKS